MESDFDVFENQSSPVVLLCMKDYFLTIGMILFEEVTSKDRFLCVLIIEGRDMVSDEVCVLQSGSRT